MRQLMLVLVFVFCAAVSAAGDDKVVRDETVPQLKVLDRYIGDWKYSMTSADGIVMEGDAKTVWIHGGKLIRQSWTMKPVAGLPGGSGENITTYDVHKNVYRQWSFSSFGMSTESTGKWDEEKKVMAWTGKDSLGNDSVTRSEFTGAGKEKFTITVKSPDGATLAAYDGESTPKQAATK